MRLTFLGKFFAGALLLLLVGGMYFVLFPSEEAPDYTQPAQLTFEPEKLPFSADSEDEYRKSTEDVTTYCTFFENYGPSRGVPAHFDAYIPEDFQESVYYYQDPDSGEQYIPAYFIQPGGNGLDLARAYAEDELERLPGCVTPPDLGGSGGVILLGFPEGRSPGGQYVETWGEIWWDSVNLNPGQVSSQAGLESGAAPVVKVASFANLTASQASDPANQTFPLNIALQRGPGVIRLGRLEFADGETRIWLELVNLTAGTLEPWVGTEKACIRPPNGACIPPSEQTDSAEEEVAISDALPAESQIPPRSSGVILSGYLTFERFDPTQPLQLELPDFTEDSEDNAVPPLVVNLPNESNSQTLEDIESEEKKKD